MQRHYFAIPALDPRPAQDELNQFCASHRVAGVESQFVAAGRDSYWALCVTVASGPEPLPDALKAAERRKATRQENGAAPRVDYKEVLSEEDFARYAELRVWRKAIAEAEGVPIYTVFTNEQLAEIVRRRVDALAALGEIDGVGPARLQRYGKPLLAHLKSTATGEEN